MTENLQALLRPRAVAVYGASADTRKIGSAILSNIIGGGYSGRVIPVNRKAASIMNIPCRPSLAGRGIDIDLAVISLPASSVLEAAQDALKAGARSLVVVSAGFGEHDQEGRKREENLRALCREAGATLLGPKSLGIINAEVSLNASFARTVPMGGSLSVISDSGALCTAILSWAAARNLGVNKVFSIGNKAGMTEIEVLRYLTEDENTRLVVGYLESIISGDTFIRVAEALSRKKPLILLHGGRTEAGRRSVQAHCGQVTGTEFAWSAAFRRSGVLEVQEAYSLIDYAACLALQPLPLGTRVAIVSNGGGGAVLNADAVEEAGMELAVLGPETREQLRRVLPPFTQVDNPVDLLGDADPLRYTKALELVQADPAVDAVLAVFSPHAMTHPAETAAAIARSFRKNKTTLLVLLGAADILPGRDQFARVGLPDLNSPRKAARVLFDMNRLRVWRERPPRVLVRFPVNQRRVERLLRRWCQTGLRQVGEVCAKEVLQAFGFKVPGGRLVSSVEEALATAERLGYPVAMKVVSPDIVHKSDVGGVKLSISEPDDLLDAYELLALRFNRHAPGARLEGIYVERMCPRGQEVVLGVRRDPQFGPVLLFGLGGIFVEELKDFASGLAPVTAHEALQMLTGTRSYHMLRRFRAGADLDLDELVEALQRLSQLATDFPAVEELEINPFMIFTPGTPAVVVDARLTLREGA